jgi:hypothetical protein
MGCSPQERILVMLQDLRKRWTKPHKAQHFFVRRSKPSGKLRLVCGSRHSSDQLEARD